MPEDRYPCPCCGYRTLPMPSVGTMEICPVCFWEDAPGENLWNGSNQVSLAVAQRNFAAFGACEPEHADLVRAPCEEEHRPEAWTSFEDCRVQLLEFIETAFRDVSRDGGVTIHQREAIDGYYNADFIADAAKKDPEVRWQDIPRAKIENLGMSLIFFDPPGIRFHLPAFMRCSLQLWLESAYADFSHSESLLFGLEDGPRSTGYFSDAFQLLNHAQHEAVAAYLTFVYCGESLSHVASNALLNGWLKWIPDSIRFPTLTNAFQ